MAGSAPAKSESWTLDICVVPPDNGWDTPEGSTIRSVLEWHKIEISESGRGVRGHDINFVYLPALNEDTAATADLQITNRTAALICFASDPIGQILTRRINSNPNNVPLLLSGGEEVLLFEKERIHPFAFALDLYRDYRAAAFADYTTKTVDEKARIGIIASRFTVNQEREAKICTELLDNAGLMPLPYWVDASVTDSFEYIAQEVKNYSHGVLISFTGSMAVKELWRVIAKNHSPWQLLYCGRPDNSFLSFRAMIFADQNLLLDKHEKFEDLKRQLWNTRALKVTDLVAAGRANALAIWATKALDTMPELGNFDKRVFIASLEKVQGIPFGSQALDIEPTTHRPKKRTVRIFEMRDRQFFPVKTLETEGLKNIMTSELMNK